MPNEEVKSAAAARANSRSNYASKEKSSGISDNYFLSQQPEDKVPSEFRKKVRREWGLMGSSLKDSGKEVFFNSIASFQFDDITGKLIINISPKVKEILCEKTIYNKMTLISEVSDIQIIP